MSSEFWVGIALSIPIGLAVNIASPAVSRRLEERSETVARRREAERQERSLLVDEFALDSAAYHAYLLAVLLRTTYVTALFGVMGGLLGAGGQALTAVDFYEVYYLSNALFLGAQVVALMAAILIMNLARGALVTIKEVQHAREDGGTVEAA